MNVREAQESAHHRPCRRCGLETLSLDISFDPIERVLMTTIGCYACGDKVTQFMSERDIGRGLNVQLYAESDERRPEPNSRQIYLEGEFRDANTL